MNDDNSRRADLRGPIFRAARRPSTRAGASTACRMRRLGRSHRSAVARSKLKRAIDLTREVLRSRPTIGSRIIPGSDTGAVEAALWSLLGARGVDVVAWEAFSEHWVIDIVEASEAARCARHESPITARSSISSSVDFDNDVVFAWNGTTSGVCVQNGDFIPADRKGLTICDATSAAFAQKLDWDKLDVVTYSWQKVLGGEAAHGMLILSPRAVERLETSYAGLAGPQTVPAHRKAAG